MKELKKVELVSSAPGNVSPSVVSMLSLETKDVNASAANFSVGPHGRTLMNAAGTFPQNKTWIEPDGENKLNDDSLLTWIKDNLSKKDNEYKLIVGTDSHLTGRIFRFVSVVALYNEGRGAYYYYTLSYKDRKDYRGNQKARMFYEVSLSIELCDWLTEVVGKRPIIHIDASPKGSGHFTASFSDQLKGYAISSGYECEIKPNSFVANCAADRHSKG